MEIATCGGFKQPFVAPKLFKQFKRIMNQRKKITKKKKNIREERKPHGEK